MGNDLAPRVYSPENMLFPLAQTFGIPIAKLAQCHSLSFALSSSTIDFRQSQSLTFHEGVSIPCKVLTCNNKHLE